MFTLTKTFNFIASRTLESTQLCMYNITVELTDSVIISHSRTNIIDDFIKSTLSNKNLNDVFDYEPSESWIAAFLYNYFKKEIPELLAFEVSESKNTKVRYEE